MADIGFLQKDKQDRDSSKKAVMVYKALQIYNINIPFWKDIQNSSNDSSYTSDSFNSNDSNDGTIESNESNEHKISRTKTKKTIKNQLGTFRKVDSTHSKCHYCDLTNVDGWIYENVVDM